jgi:hypothetical protein
MLEAKAAGAAEISFHVNLRTYEGEGMDGMHRWAARATLDEPPNVPHVATGRTGEEALRELVTYLKAIGG